MPSFTRTDAGRRLRCRPVRSSFILLMSDHLNAVQGSRMLRQFGFVSGVHRCGHCLVHQGSHYDSTSIGNIVYIDIDKLSASYDVCTINLFPVCNNFFTDRLFDMPRSASRTSFCIIYIDNSSTS